MSVHVRVLGPIALEVDSVELPLPGRQIRTVLAALALRRPDYVSVEQLVDTLWIDDPPRTAVTQVHGHVSWLRRAMGCDSARHPHPACPIVTEFGGYRLDAVDTDLCRFQAHIALAAHYRDGGDRGAEVDCLRGALALWRGSPCADVGAVATLSARTSGLVEAYLDTVEDYAAATVALGRPREAVDLLRRLRPAHPHRERLLGHLMAALALSGRVGEAVVAYRDGRRSMLDDLGVEPSAEVQQLHTALLRGQARPFGTGLLPPAPWQSAVSGGLAAG